MAHRRTSTSPSEPGAVELRPISPTDSQDSLASTASSLDRGAYNAENSQNGVHSASPRQGELLVQDRSDCLTQTSEIRLLNSERRANDDLSDHSLAETWPKAHPVPLWVPFFLRPTTILGFLATYALLLAALIGLQVYDRQNQGLATTDLSKQFLWTYGPTAVLASIAALWAQVEFRTKLLLPWKILLHGPTPASDTLLVDYISSSVIEALPRAYRLSHWPVFLTIVASLLIKLLTVISTALFTLQEEKIVLHDVLLSAADIFEGTSFNKTPIDFTPVLSTIALQDQNLTYGAGIAENVAFPTLSIADSSEEIATTYQRLKPIVDTFQADLDCIEEGTITSAAEPCTRRGCTGSQPVLSITSPSCSGTVFDSPIYDISLSEVFFGFASLIQCSNIPSGVENRRLIVAAGHLVPNTTTPDYVQIAVPNGTTMFVCQPRYTVQKAELAISPTGILDRTDFSLGDQKVGSTVSPISPWDLYEAFNASLIASSRMLADDQRTSLDSQIAPSLDFFFQLIEVTFAPRNLSQLEDPGFLHHAATHIFRAVSAQIAKAHLMVPAAEELQATSETTQQRLRIRTLPLYLMQGILVVMMVKTWLIRSLLLPFSACRDPGSIGAIATILSRSGRFLERMSGHGKSGLKRLGSALSAYQCRAEISLEQSGSSDAQFSVLLDEQGESADILACTNDGPELSDEGWWTPFSTSPWFIALTLAMTLSVIIGLEVAFWRSEKAKGLADVSNSGYIRYTWSYVPALAMVTIQLMVGSVGYSLLTILPYYNLRTAKACGRRDLLTEYLSKLNIAIIGDSIVRLRYLPLIISLSLFLTPFLTIVVSGLYTPQLVDRHETVTIEMDHYDFDFVSIGNASSEATNTRKRSTFPVLMELLTQHNYSSPAWTYKDLVIPRLSLQQNDTSLDGQPEDGTADELERTLEVIVPAYQPKLRCSKQAENHFFNATKGRIELESWSEAQKDDLSCTNQFLFMPSYLEQRPFGLFDGNKWGIGDHNLVNLSDSRNDGCIAAAGVFGVDGEKFTNVVCTTSLDQIATKTTFRLPDYSIITASTEPSATATPVSRDFLNVYSGGTFSDLLLDDPVDLQFSAFFQLLLEGKDSATVASFLHPDNADAVIAAITRQYQIMLAQAWSDVLRPGAVTDYSLSSPFFNASNMTADRLRSTVNATGTLIDPNRYRLHQSLVSTRILDALLGTILLCVGLSCYLMPMRKKDEILPKNPCSIAAAASLIAGSELVRMVPAQAEWWSDEELEKKGVWEGCRFRMGWFEEVGKGQEGGDEENEGGRERRRFAVDVRGQEVSGESLEMDEAV